MADGGEEKRQHRKPTAGVSGAKKELRDKQKRGVSTAKTNQRVRFFSALVGFEFAIRSLCPSCSRQAFAVSGAGKAARQIQRNLDRTHKKEVVHITNRIDEEPPPVVVVVMGPPGCGKSTLIKVRVLACSDNALT